MLDRAVRRYADPLLDRVAAALARRGVRADAVTGAGFACSLAAFAALYDAAYGAALLFILLSRLADGLDGPVARASQTGPTDRGAYFDIVCDFVFYAGAVFFFAAGRPECALAAAFLLFSFMGTAATFLTRAIVAARRGLHDARKEKKSFHYAAGLCEGTETVAFLILICLLPDLFVPLAVCFGILCWITTAGRVLGAGREL